MAKKKTTKKTTTRNSPVRRKAPAATGRAVSKKQDRETIGKINYYLVGDQTGTITNYFGVMREGQGLADRATFLIDPDGVIQAMEITAEGIGRDADDLMRKVKAAQYVRKHPGEVCPAKWKEGEETLAPSLDLVGKI